MTAKSSTYRTAVPWALIVVLGLGMGVPAAREGRWTRAVAFAGGVWLALGLPLAAAGVVRKQREQRSALRNLLAAIEQSPSAVMIVDLNGGVEYANAGMCNQIGYPRRELIGRSLHDFQPDTAPSLFQDMMTTVRGGASWQGEWPNRRKKGEPYPVRGTVTPVKDSTGRVACLVAVFEDMTEIKRSEGLLRAALDRAETADRAKSRFLATMSHEVRTPLNGIVGFSGLLFETPLTPDQREYVHTIRTSSEALIQLTTDILDFSRIESGGLKLEAQPANPRACVEDALDLLAVQAAQKNVELLHFIDDDVPAIVMLDEPRLRQVLVNLVSNAVKFTESGAVEVKVSGARAPDTAADWRLTLAVRDTGIGIAPENLDLLFKPFSQLDEPTARRYGGAGLGLAISQNLVQLMGGKITTESSPGQGSLFTFTITVAAVPGMVRPVPDLTRLRVAFVASRGPFYDEFTALARRWGVSLVEVSSPAGLSSASWDVAFVELGPDLAGRWVAQADERAGLPAQKMYGVVSVSLPSELRSALRPSFCQILNKPLHHDALLGLLSGLRADPPEAKQPRGAFGLTVLVVEDNLVNQRLVIKLLGNLGCKSTVAGNGRLAVDELARGATPYDLVLMDLHMPELDGLGAIEKMRAGEAGEAARRVWVTVLTADARKDQKDRVFTAGANDYLLKPVSLSELADSLRRFSDARAGMNLS